MFFKSVYIKYKIVLPLKLVFITVFFAITENKQITWLHYEKKNTLIQ